MYFKLIKFQLSPLQTKSWPTIKMNDLIFNLFIKIMNLIIHEMGLQYKKAIVVVVEHLLRSSLFNLT